MIDVLKRLAELDAVNPNIVKESDQKVDECGMMPEMGMMSMPPERPSHPASINMTAGSGEELSDMLTTIMTLAGQSGHGHAEPMSAPPAAPLEPVGPEPDATSSMRSVIDKLNPMDGDDEEGEPEDDAERKPVDEYDNTPEDPNDKSEFDPNQFAHQENQPGQGDRMDGNMPKGIPTMEEVEKQLFADYRKFVSEN